MSDPWEGYEPPASLLQALADVVGITEFDRSDVLHRKLLKALADVGPGGSTRVGLLWVGWTPPGGAPWPGIWLARLSHLLGHL